MNVILGDCEERRIPKRSLTEASKNKDRDHNELRRNLGLIILRGSQIINVTIEGPGPQDNARIQRPIKQAVGPSKNFGTKGGDNATLGGKGIRKPDNGRNPTSRPFGRPGQRGPPPKRTH